MNISLYPDTKKELFFETDYKPLPDLHGLEDKNVIALYENIKQAMNNAALYHSQLLEIALYDDFCTLESELFSRGINI